MSVSKTFGWARPLGLRQTWFPLLVLLHTFNAIADSHGVIEEIIVTASRLEKNLLQVPMSVNVLSGQFIEETNLTSLYDLQFDVPGLVVTNLGFFGAAIGLRGVADQGGSGASVAPYFNGHYLGNSSLALSRPFDMERIEVLKGPQGTLYGRNATGGAINLISQKPEAEFSAAIEGAAASFDTARMEGYLNIPLEGAAIRLALTGSAGDGFIHNSVDNRKFAEQDYFGARGSVEVRPLDKLTINVMAQHLEDDGASGDLWLPRKDYLPDSNDIYLATVTLEDPYLKTQNDIVTAEVAYQFKSSTLKSVSGYSNNVSRGRDDCAGIPLLAGCVRTVNPDSLEAWSQEINLVSRADAEIEWLAGLYYLRQRLVTDYTLIAPLINPEILNNSSELARRTAYAGYAQLTGKLNQFWSLTGGIRQSHESTSSLKSGTGFADSKTPRSIEGRWNNTSWRLQLEYAPRDTLLLYGSASTGFKSGGVTTFLLPNAEYDQYDPEELTAYELGAKLRSSNGKIFLTGSAFLYDFQDLQVETTAIFGNQVLTVTDNAASAKIRGLDLSSEAMFGERLSLSGSLVWLPQREFVDFASASGDDLSGNHLIRAPEWTASMSLSYLSPIPGVGDLTTRVVYNYRSRFFFTRENDPLLSQGGFGLLNLFLRLEPASSNWYLFASARNALDKEYYNQVFLQSAPGMPVNYEVGVGLRY